MITKLWDATEGIAYADTIEVNDPDKNESFKFKILESPDWLIINDAGILSGSPGNEDVVTGFPVLITVEDNGGLLDTLFTKINVLLDIIIINVEISQEEAIVKIGETIKYSAKAVGESDLSFVNTQPDDIVTMVYSGKSETGWNEIPFNTFKGTITVYKQPEEQPDELPEEPPEEPE